VKTRRSQNRQAQRRFRERKQQQETTLMARLQELQSKNDELSLFITSLKQENCVLASDKSRLYQEVELLRKWRSKLFSLMSKLVKEDEMTNDQQTTISRSCSNTCWRRGSEYLRLMVTMQTLLSLFDDLQLASGGG
jgi:predicted nuclease with TOPRIM domain